MSNEKFQQSILTTNQKLHRFDLSPYLETYIDGLGMHEKNLKGISIYPNPAEDEIIISSPQEYDGKTYTIFNSKGERIETGTITTTKTIVRISNWLTGLSYFLSIDNSYPQTIQFIKE